MIENKNKKFRNAMYLHLIILIHPRTMHSMKDGNILNNLFRNLDLISHEK